MSPTPSAQYSLTIRVEIEDRPGMLGKVASAIGEADGTIGAIDLVEVGERLVRDITVDAHDADHWDQILTAIETVEGAHVLDSTDRTFLMHVGGKIEQRNKTPLKTRDDLSMAYTPGVARVCTAIADDPEKAFQYTIKRNTVAVVSDGTAVLGLGDIGPRAAMPVMEGKAMLFKEFAGVDAFPICLDTKDPDEIVETVRLIAPGFGGINLEDISAPRCFEIEDRLKEELDIPVFHDDQHGTAIVVLAALLNACKLTGRDLMDLRVLVTGLGAAGVAVTKILLQAGVRDIIGCDSRGIVSTEREDYLDGSMNAIKRWYAETTNPEKLVGDAGRRDRGHGPLHRPLRRARDARRGARGHAPRRDGLRDGQPDARGQPRGGRAVRADHRDRPLGLPEPDQQRARLPRHLPRRARRARAADHRGHEDGGRARRSPRSSPTTSCARTTSSRRCSTATSRPPWPPRSPRRRALTGAAPAEQHAIGFAPGDVEALRGV